MFSSRMNGIELSGIRKMFDIATENSVNLGLGEPDFQPPAEAVDAVHRAMKLGFNKYGPTNGIPELRNAISDRLKRYWKACSPGNVIVTSSGSEALFSTAMTFIDGGNSILVPEPGFVLYKPHSQLAGGSSIPYNLLMENEFRPDVDEIERKIEEGTKAIMVNSPNNPTGGMITRQDRDDLIDVARDSDLVLISDEVYDAMIYRGSVHHSFLGKYENAVVINSFSKIYAMTGWRIGYMAAEDDIIGKLSLAHYHIVACPPSPIQYGALEALRKGDPYISRMVREFRERRDLITKRINRIGGFRALTPPGTFYSFPSYDLRNGNERIKSGDLAMELARSGLICSPGTAFGESGEYHLRFSFVNSKESIERGMDILSDVARNYHS
ncbi:MAG: pyridoxal phosphate-dependent aminotransferase [Thermoplasmatota archaeon]